MNRSAVPVAFLIEAVAALGRVSRPKDLRNSSLGGMGKRSARDYRRYRWLMNRNVVSILYA